MSKKQIATLFFCSLVPWTVGNGLVPLLPVYAGQLGANQSMAGNYLCNPHTSMVVTAWGTGGRRWSQTPQSLKQWQQQYSWSDQSANTDIDKSKQSVLVINDTLETCEIPLRGGGWRDLDGKGVRGPVTLKPFTSMILVSGGSGNAAQRIYASQAQ